MEGRRAREFDKTRRALTTEEREVVQEALLEFEAHLEQRLHMTIEQFGAMLRDLRDTVLPWVHQRVEQDRQWNRIKWAVRKDLIVWGARAMIVAMLVLAYFGAAEFWSWLEARYL